MDVQMNVHMCVCLAHMFMLFTQMVISVYTELKPVTSILQVLNLPHVDICGPDICLSSCVVLFCMNISYCVPLYC